MDPRVPWHEVRKDHISRKATWLCGWVSCLLQCYQPLHSEGDGPSFYRRFSRGAWWIEFLALFYIWVHQLLDRPHQPTLFRARWWLYRCSTQGYAPRSAEVSLHGIQKMPRYKSRDCSVAKWHQYPIQSQRLLVYMMAGESFRWVDSTIFWCWFNRVGRMFTLRSVTQLTMHNIYSASGRIIYLWFPG